MKNRVRGLKGNISEKSGGGLSAEKIVSLLTTEAMGRKIYFYPVTDSTNHRARLESMNGAPHGSLFVAEEQTAARGRLGKQWSAPPETGVWMSLLLRPDGEPGDIAQITLIAGVAVCKAIQSLTGLAVGIKWPNDIVIGGKKLCGILTEMAAQSGRIESLICGIGINVNTKAFPRGIADVATSVFIESGKEQARAQLAAEVLNRFEPLYREFVSRGVTREFLQTYRDCCVTLGRQVTAYYRDGAITGTAENVTEKGELEIRTEQGELIAFSSGEVSVRGMLGYC